MKPRSRRLFVLAAAAMLAATLQAPAQATFPGRDGRIAFVRSGDIYSIRADGTGILRLTSGASTDGNPVWDPAGTHIAFARSYGSNFDVWVMRSDGTEQRRLTGSSAVDWKPSWSRDGSRIAFASNRYGSFDIFTMRRDGTNLLRVTSTSYPETHPAFSPTSSRIVFQREIGGQSDLFSVIDPAYCGQPSCGSETRYTSSSSQNETSPNWAKDGGSIVYTERRGDFTGIRRYWPGSNIFTYLARHAGSLVADGACSPDGRDVVYTRVFLPDGPVEVWRASCSGEQSAVRVATGYDPDWQALPSLAQGEEYSEGPTQAQQ